jgi:hypothetical protein
VNHRDDGGKARGSRERVNPPLEKRKAPARAAVASRPGLHLHAHRTCRSHTMSSRWSGHDRPDRAPSTAATEGSATHYACRFMLADTQKPVPRSFGAERGRREAVREQWWGSRSTCGGSSVAAAGGVEGRVAGVASIGRTIPRFPGAATRRRLGGPKPRLGPLSRPPRGFTCVRLAPPLNPKGGRHSRSVARHTPTHIEQGRPTKRGGSRRAGAGPRSGPQAEVLRAGGLPHLVQELGLGHSQTF